jgi:CRISPR-associated protein Csx17
MSESDRTIDWSKTTFEGSRREQLRRWRELTVRQRLEALDRLSDLAGPFEQQKTGQETTAGPPQDLHAGAVREPQGKYGKRRSRKTPPRK